ncbi:MAG: DNA recombination protein RmuC [ANME-2 cluster archaeon]|nr:DNA recombination protein RmuC [ANME-2 cluster archaeon]MDF1530843.1 DNA recombination protein RmuC [ANME-2 cluster archaeon]
MMLTDTLLGTIIVLLFILILLVLKQGKVEPRDVESAVSNTWVRLGLDKRLGELTTYAGDIRDNYRSLEQMLRVPTQRGALGEMALETILTDQLPPGMFGIRTKVFDGRVPDAYIRSTVGIICIDSKFPLENYIGFMENVDPKVQDGFKRQFLRDVQGHLDKIAQDYVRPDMGSAEFAFAYIHSEGVYWFLVNEGFEMLREFTKKGVQVVSPLTLSHKIELIKAGVHARKLSEDAQQVQAALAVLSRRFIEIDDKWRVFHQTHLRNLGNKAVEIDSAYNELRSDFDRIGRLSDE